MSFSMEVDICIPTWRVDMHTAKGVHLCIFIFKILMLIAELVERNGGRVFGSDTIFGSVMWRGNLVLQRWMVHKKATKMWMCDHRVHPNIDQLTIEDYVQTISGTRSFMEHALLKMSWVHWVALLQRTLRDRKWAIPLNASQWVEGKFNYWKRVVTIRNSIMENRTWSAIW